MKTLTDKTLLHAFIAAIALSWAGSAAAQEEQAQPADNQDEEITVVNKNGHGQAPRVPQTFGSSPIQGWYTLDDKTLIINTTRGDYKATFMNNCQGIQFAEQIGFDSSGGAALDKFTTVVLPDGQRCFFKELTTYSGESEAREG